MNLIIDLGNTRGKLAVFSEGKMLEHAVIDNPVGLETIEAFIGGQPELKRAILCSVTQTDKRLVKMLTGMFSCIIFNERTAVPIDVQYKTAESLGRDRLAAAVAASVIFPHQNTLVIDAGSCVTYDVVNASGKYLGGAISPGIEMRFRSLHEFTKNLPLISSREDTALTGNSTRASIFSGVLNGIATEINGMIAAYRKKFTELKVLLTGGDLPFFEKAVKSASFADRFLVLRGLNNILEYNA